MTLDPKLLGLFDRPVRDNPGLCWRDYHSFVVRGGQWSRALFKLPDEEIVKGMVSIRIAWLEFIHLNLEPFDKRPYLLFRFRVTLINAGNISIVMEVESKSLRGVNDLEGAREEKEIPKFHRKGLLLSDDLPSRTDYARMADMSCTNVVNPVCKEHVNMVNEGDWRREKEAERWQVCFWDNFYHGRGWSFSGLEFNWSSQILRVTSFPDI